MGRGLKPKVRTRYPVGGVEYPSSAPIWWTQISSAQTARENAKRLGKTKDAVRSAARTIGLVLKSGPSKEKIPADLILEIVGAADHPIQSGKLTEILQETWGSVTQRAVVRRLHYLSARGLILREKIPQTVAYRLPTPARKELKL